MAELKASFKARQEARLNPKKEEHTNYGNESFNKIANLYSRKSVFEIEDTEDIQRIRSNRRMSRRN